MFGEYVDEELDLKVDAKGRIIIPKTTGVEPKEELCFRLSLDNSKLFLENSQTREGVFYIFEESLRRLKEQKEIDYRKQLQLRRIFYGMHNFMPEKVDEHRRIVIPKEARTTMGIEGIIHAQLIDGYIILTKPQILSVQKQKIK